MSQGTSIEWTQATWNPVTGCDRVSPGCDHCYALTLAKRLKAMGNQRYQRDGQQKTSGPGFGVTLHADKLEEPLTWRKPRLVFVNSMSDLFHPDVPDDFIIGIFWVMATASQHTFQVLTKRPRRMAAMMPRVWGVLEQERLPVPSANVWLGTSVEDQKWADQRIPLLLETPAAVRFLSCEPLLGPITFRWRPWIGYNPGWRERGEDQYHLDALQGSRQGTGDIHWVIVGGESGPGARPMRPEWARSIRDECIEAGVPFFFKQWGGRTPKAGGRELDDRLWDEMPIPTASDVAAASRRRDSSAKVAAALG